MKKKLLLILFVTILIILLIINYGFFITLFNLLILYFILFIAYKCYVRWYFKSNQFNTLKAKVKTHIDNCNDLNEHIEFLKSTYETLNFKKTQYWNCRIC